MRNSKSGYESLVEAAKMASQNFNSLQQHQLVLGALEKAVPLPILHLASSSSPFSHNSIYSRVRPKKKRKQSDNNPCSISFHDIIITNCSNEPTHTAITNLKRASATCSCIFLRRNRMVGNL